MDAWVCDWNLLTGPQSTGSSFKIRMPKASPSSPTDRRRNKTEVKRKNHSLRERPLYPEESARGNVSVFDPAALGCFDHDIDAFVFVHGFSLLNARLISAP